MPERELCGLQRKSIAKMPPAGWRHMPHATLIYEPEVTKRMQTLTGINIGREDDHRV